MAKKSAATPFQRGRLTFASLVWKIDGVEVACPTPAQLNSLDETRGDGVYLKHGVAKNDFFGHFFAATPSFLPFFLHAPRNAARALAALEIAAAVSPAERDTTPLFGPTVGAEFTHYQVETAFELMLLYGARVAPDLLHDYSVHSFRIWVASALLAAKVPRDVIKRLIRWRSDESLEIYARLNDSEWRGYVQSTYTAAVDSTVAARLASVGVVDLDALAVGFVGAV
jgi:hypothetical protein